MLSVTTTRLGGPPERPLQLPMSGLPQLALRAHAVAPQFVSQIVALVARVVGRVHCRGRVLDAVDLRRRELGRDAVVVQLAALCVVIP